MENNEVVQVTTSGLIQDLRSGLNRKEIAVKYGLTQTQVKEIFKNPKLKNKKVSKQRGASYQLIDDLPDEEQEQEQVYNEAAQEEDALASLDEGEEQVIEEEIEEEVEEEVQRGFDPFS